MLCNTRRQKPKAYNNSVQHLVQLVVRLVYNKSSTNRSSGIWADKWTCLLCLRRILVVVGIHTFVSLSLFRNFGYNLASQTASHISPFERDRHTINWHGEHFGFSTPVCFRATSAFATDGQTDRRTRGVMRCVERPRNKCSCYLLDIRQCFVTVGRAGASWRVSVVGRTHRREIDKSTAAAAAAQWCATRPTTCQVRLAAFSLRSTCNLLVSTDKSSSNFRRVVYSSYSGSIHFCCYSVLYYVVTEYWIENQSREVH